jgi:GNAT superfamily N-acetyltransferase
MNTRPAVASDAWNVALIHVQTWQAAYRGIVPDAYLDSLSVDTRERFWQESITRGTPEVWVAEIDSQLVGWASFGPSRDQDAEQEVGELEAIYVNPKYWATGTGRALWLVSRRRLIERGFSSATLWVLTDNVMAIRFYRAAGFAPDPASEKGISVGGRTLREMRYQTKLEGGADT